MSDMNNSNVSQKDIVNAQKVPAWLQYAFVKAGEAIKYNSAWGFITADEAKGSEFKALEKDFKAQQGKLVLVSAVSNGYVFELPFNMMTKIFKTVLPDVSDEFITKYLTENQKIYKQDKIDCGKYIDRIINDKVEPVKTVNYYKMYDFGLYCVNQSYAIKDGDTTYKAYKMSVESLKKILAAKGVADRFYVSDGKSTPIPITSVNVGKVIKIADSGNGVVFKLCYRG